MNNQAEVTRAHSPGMGPASVGQHVLECSAGEHKQVQSEPGFP